MTTIIRAWHASRAPITEWRPYAHFGSEAQARMRSYPGDTLHHVELRFTELKRLKDRPHWPQRLFSRYTRTGVDGIVYTNRYEGIDHNAFEAARAAGHDLDLISDSAFLKAVPAATDSWIVFAPGQITVIEQIQT